MKQLVAATLTPFIAFTAVGFSQVTSLERLAKLPDPATLPEDQAQLVRFLLDKHIPRSSAVLFLAAAKQDTTILKRQKYLEGVFLAAGWSVNADEYNTEADTVPATRAAARGIIIAKEASGDQNGATLAALADELAEKFKAVGISASVRDRKQVFEFRFRTYAAVGLYVLIGPESSDTYLSTPVTSLLGSPKQTDEIGAVHQQRTLADDLRYVIGLAYSRRLNELEGTSTTHVDPDSKFLLAGADHCRIARVAAERYPTGVPVLSCEFPRKSITVETIYRQAKALTPDLDWHDCWGIGTWICFDGISRKPYATRRMQIGEGPVPGYLLDRSKQPESYIIEHSYVYFWLYNDHDIPEKPRLPPRNFANTTLADLRQAMSNWKFEFVKLPAGEFQMGSTDRLRCRSSDEDCATNERPQHRVRITRPFEIGKYEVTAGMWEWLMGTDSYEGITSGVPWSDPAGHEPMCSLTWGDTQDFLSRLNAMNDGHFYRLPTEAEWEYAARAGTGGIGPGNFDEYATYLTVAPRQVGKLKPNAWRIYDMLGNVAEWVSDWYDGRYYQSSPMSDPQGPVTGVVHITRGGSFWDRDGADLNQRFYSFLTVSARRSAVERSMAIGFRCVRTPLP